MLIMICAAELCGDFNRDRAIINCIWMAFYFLLRPGEYANATDNAKHPFRMSDVKLNIGGLHIFNAYLATITQITSADFISLTFTYQENSTKGEKLSHMSNGQPFVCPSRDALHNSSNTTLLPPLHSTYILNNKVGSAR